MDKRPNIILIMTDEMRGDCLGYAGHPDVKTPYLDSWLQKEYIFLTHILRVQLVCRLVQYYIQDYHKGIQVE